MICASGVLPVSVNPEGKIVLLLGREIPDESETHLNYGKQSGTWCGFGGKLEKEEIVEEGAAREFADRCVYG